MLVYIFWHVPFAEISRADYEKALVGFHSHLAAAPPPGFVSSATYRISEVPWLADRAGYEDWCFVKSSAVLDDLNMAAVVPERWDAHFAIASKTDFGHGGLYYHLHGDTFPVVGSRLVWLKRPRNIRYEHPLREITSNLTGFISCWRKQMVLGPAPEFLIVGNASLEVSPPQGWQSLIVERSLLGPTSHA